MPLKKMACYIIRDTWYVLTSRENGVLSDKRTLFCRSLYHVLGHFTSISGLLRLGRTMCRVPKLVTTNYMPQ